MCVAACCVMTAATAGGVRSAVAAALAGGRTRGAGAVEQECTPRYAYLPCLAAAQGDPARRQAVHVLAARAIQMIMRLSPAAFIVHAAVGDANLAHLRAGSQHVQDAVDRGDANA